MSHSPLALHPPPDPAVLESWLQTRGARRHQGIRPVLASDGSGWGVWASEDIARGEILSAIPRQSILSARTSSLQRDYQPESAADIILHLTACLLHELRLGTSSEWYGWLQMIPRETVLLPTFWSEESVGGEDGRKAMEWLGGTEAEKQLQRKDGESLSLEALRQYHSALDLPPTSNCPEQSPFPTFLYAYSMVSSRGFALDTYHLIGLIPFCDMFNHSSTSAHTSLSVDSNVCETCGSLLQCEHDTTSERLEHLSADYLAKLETDGMADMVDMRVQRDIRSGEQVFSCYDDEHADAELMVEYGFIEGGNTAITWSYRNFLDPNDPEIAQRFMSLLQRAGLEEHMVNYEKPFIGIPQPEGQGPEPLVIRPTGELSRSLATIIFNSNVDDNHSVEQIGNDLDLVIQKLNHQDYSPHPELRRMADEVCGLIQKRLATFHRDEKSLEDLQEYVETLNDHQHELERMAATHMLSERKLLQSCYDRWRSIVE